MYLDKTVSNFNIGHLSVISHNIKIISSPIKLNVYKPNPNISICGVNSDFKHTVWTDKLVHNIVWHYIHIFFFFANSSFIQQTMWHSGHLWMHKKLSHIMYLMWSRSQNFQFSIFSFQTDSSWLHADAYITGYWLQCHRTQKDRVSAWS